MLRWPLRCPLAAQPQKHHSKPEHHDVVVLHAWTSSRQASALPRHDGAAVAEAERKNREEDYPDVEGSPHACLLSLGVETYGRWSPHSQDLLAKLVRKKARGVSDVLRRATERAYSARWWSLLAVALQRAIAESVLRESGADLMPAEGSVELPLPMEFV